MNEGRKEGRKEEGRRKEGNSVFRWFGFLVLRFFGLSVFRFCCFFSFSVFRFFGFRFFGCLVFRFFCSSVFSVFGCSVFRCVGFAVFRFFGVATFRLFVFFSLNARLVIQWRQRRGPKPTRRPESRRPTDLKPDARPQSTLVCRLHHSEGGRPGMQATWGCRIRQEGWDRRGMQSSGVEDRIALLRRTGRAPHVEGLPEVTSELRCLSL